MDISELKKQSDLSYDTAIAKRNALERAHSRQVVVYKEHIFKSDPHTICLVESLKKHQDTFFVLDSNNNPVEITEPDEFLSLLIARNQESLNAYHQIYKTFHTRGE
jgi:hypothetical protein